MLDFSFHNFGCEVYSKTNQYFEMPLSAAILYTRPKRMHYGDWQGKHTGCTKGMPGRFCFELRPSFDLCMCRVCSALECNFVASCSDTIYHYNVTCHVVLFNNADMSCGYRPIDIGRTSE